MNNPILVIKKLAQNDFVKKVAIVATGFAGAQAITLAFMPLITRLYGPVEYGILGTFLALIAVLIPAAALTYPMSIVLPKCDSDAKKLARLSILIAFLMAALVAVLLTIFKADLAVKFGVSELLEYWFFIPLAMFFASTHQVMHQWLIRKKQFNITAKVAAFQSLCLNGAKTVGGIFHPYAITLIALTAVGYLAHCLMLIIGLFTGKSENRAAEVNLQKNTPISTIAKQYIDFPLYRAPQVTVNAISQSAPVILLAGMFGPAAAGFFALSKSALSAPALLIGQSVGDVIYPRMAEMVSKGENPKALFFKSTLMLFGIALPPFLIITIFGPDIFSFVFGSQWHEAGEYARWISLWLLISLVARPAIAAIPILKLQGLFLANEILFLAINIALLLIGFYLFESALMAVFLYSIGSILLHLAIIILVYFRVISGVYADK